MYSVGWRILEPTRLLLSTYLDIGNKKLTLFFNAFIFSVIGRDGLTHNMLDNIHALWKRRRVCKIKCKGVCTVDMDNVCQQLEVGFRVYTFQSSILCFQAFYI